PGPPAGARRRDDAVRSLGGAAFPWPPHPPIHRLVAGPKGRQIGTSKVPGQYVASGRAMRPAPYVRRPAPAAGRGRMGGLGRRDAGASRRPVRLPRAPRSPPARRAWYAQLATAYAFMRIIPEGARLVCTVGPRRARGAPAEGRDGPDGE